MVRSMVLGGVVTTSLVILALGLASRAGAKVVYGNGTGKCTSMFVTTAGGIVTESCLGGSCDGWCSRNSPIAGTGCTCNAGLYLVEESEA